MIEIEYLPTASLHAAPYNPRKMPDEQMARLMRGIEAFGLVDPIIVNQATGNIVGGHQRVEAAKRLKLAQVPVVHVSLDRDQEKALNLALNKISGEWDLDALRDILGDLSGEGFDLDLTGFSADEVADLLAGDEVNGDDERELGDPDEVPEVDEQAPPVTQPGDLIILGTHRLLCGDSTDPLVVRRILQGDQIDMAITDPPYNVAYQVNLTPEQAKKAKRRTDGKEVANDAMGDEAFAAFLGAAFKTLAANLAPGAPVYVYHADSERIPFQQAMEAAGIGHRQTLIWVKSTFALGRQDHHWQHEPALYGWKDGAAHRWYGGRDKATVIDDGPLTRPALEKLTKPQLVDMVEGMLATPTSIFREAKPSRSEEHPTSKPVALYERHMLNSSQPGDIVFDGFGGYGPMVIAAEKHGRIARIVELNPAYCDAIVRRWEAWTGKTAQRPEREAASGKPRQGRKAAV